MFNRQLDFLKLVFRKHSNKFAELELGDNSSPTLPLPGYSTGWHTEGANPTNQISDGAGSPLISVVGGSAGNVVGDHRVVVVRSGGGAE